MKRELTKRGLADLGLSEKQKAGILARFTAYVMGYLEQRSWWLLVTGFVSSTAAFLATFFTLDPLPLVEEFFFLKVAMLFLRVMWRKRRREASASR